MKRFSMCMAAILATVVMLVLFIQIRNARTNEFLATFQNDTETITREITITLNSSSDKLRSVIGFFEGSEIVHEAELNAFASSLEMFSEHSRIRALAVMPVLKRAETGNFLAQLEQRAKVRSDLGYTPIDIKVFPDRDIYAPVVYVVSPKGPRGILGYDIGSSTIRLQTALEAQKTGRILITPPVTLSQDGRASFPSVLMLAATQAGNLGLRNDLENTKDRPTFIAISYTPGAVLSDIYQNIVNPQFNFAIRDTTDKEDLLIFDSRTAQAEAANSKHLLSRSITFGGRQWTIDFYPTPQRVKALAPIEDIVVLVIGITLLIALMFAGDRLIRNKDILSLTIEQRTRELNAAKEEAEKSNRAKSEFLAAMSHDLRTPLNAIMGFSEVMMQKTFGPLGDPLYAEYIADIHSSGELLVSLINDVLDLSKIEAGKYVLADQTLQVSALVELCVRQLRTSARLSELTIKTDIPADFPNLMGDKRVLVQVLNNLISNAVKFTPAQGTVTISAGLADDKSIRIAVEDTGAGMSDDDIEKAVRPFEQVSSMHSNKNDGTGLGLYLCYNFMALFAGELKIESALDRGTKVILKFPPERTIY